MPSGAAAAVADALTQRYLDLVRDHEPVTWTRLGGTGRDDALPERTPDGLGALDRALTGLHVEVVAARDRLPSSASGGLREARDDLVLLADELEHRRFLLDQRPRHRHDPLAALETVASGIHELLRRDDLPAPETARRAAAAVARAAAVPAFLEDAGRLLDGVPRPHLTVAAGRLDGLVALVTDALPAAVARSGGDVAAASVVVAAAGEALRAFGALLDQLRDATPAPWRHGPGDHATVTRCAIGTELDAATTARRAERQLATVRDELAEIAAAGWRRRFPGRRRPADVDGVIRAVLDDVADRTALRRGALVGEARRAVTEAHVFARELRLCDVPPLDHLQVVEAPPYLAGLAVAFITAPPALDPDAGCVYHLSSVPDALDEAAATSFLREYHAVQLRSLGLHEGYPGHAVQLEHAARHPRIVRRVVGRPAFAEGWAVHVEREARHAGFAAGATSAVDGEDYALVQRKLELRIAANALLDVGLHAGDLDDVGARALLIDRAFQEPAEVDGKLVRAQVTCGQLSSYFVGGAEVGDLVAAADTAGRDRREVHQALLSHGTPSTPVLRRALADTESEVRRPFA